MSRKIVIDKCFSCPSYGHKGGFAKVSYVPVCRWKGKELPHTVEQGDNKDFIYASPTGVIPDWCELEKN